MKWLDCAVDEWFLSHTTSCLLPSSANVSFPNFTVIIIAIAVFILSLLEVVSFLSHVLSIVTWVLHHSQSHMKEFVTVFLFGFKIEMNPNNGQNQCSSGSRPEISTLH